MQWSRFVSVSHLIPHARGGERFTLFDFLHAIPNGGARSKAEAGRLRAEGVKAGVSDLFVAIPTADYCGLYLEMKAPRPMRSSVTDAQSAWIERARMAGYAAEVAHGTAEALDIINRYLRPTAGK